MNFIVILANALVVTSLAYFLTKKALNFTGKQPTTPNKTLLFATSAIILYSHYSVGLSMLLYFIPYMIFWYLIDIKRSKIKK